MVHETGRPHRGDTEPTDGTLDRDDPTDGSTTKGDPTYGTLNKGRTPRWYTEQGENP